LSHERQALQALPAATAAAYLARNKGRPIEANELTELPAAFSYLTSPPVPSRTGHVSQQHPLPPLPAPRTPVRSTSTPADLHSQVDEDACTSQQTLEHHLSLLGVEFSLVGLAPIADSLAASGSPEIEPLLLRGRGDVIDVASGESRVAYRRFF
jgi:hypothetical protein